MHVDWRLLFIPSNSILEIILRGSVMYFFIFFLFRIFRRQAGAVGISDLLVVVLVADAAQNGMAGDYKSITEGALLVGTIVVWDFFFDWLGFKSPFLLRVFRPAPMLLIRNGRIQRRNLSKEMITEEELMAQLREQGIEHLSDVKESYLEGDGRISVIKKESKEDSEPGNDSEKNVGQSQ
jgi:uncharacterized membrane protein YcaP (DUF421 family)